MHSTRRCLFALLLALVWTACDGDRVQEDTDPVAQNPSCDDGVLNGDETDVDCGGECNPCDAGATCSEAADCVSGVCAVDVCAAATCGDGVVNGMEACDDAGESSTCDPDCSAAACGDGYTNETAGEICDDGVNDGGEGECLSCTGLQQCGDGVTEGTEACDDGNTLTETCAYGSASCEVCASDCSLQAGATSVCGDTIVDSTNGEECDDGAESATCNGDCTLAECGDGILNASAGEACDDGAESATCNSDCTLAECGDGVLNASAGETCDDGDTVPLDGCDDDCQLESFFCAEANGLRWCRPESCGEPCNDVCAGFGLTPVADSATWLAAQDTLALCSNIAGALRVSKSVSVGNFIFACTEEITSHFMCSYYSDCPTNLLTNMDQLGNTDCSGSGVRAVCPCE